MLSSHLIRVLHIMYKFNDLMHNDNSNEPHPELSQLIQQTLMDSMGALESDYVM